MMFSLFILEKEIGVKETQYQTEALNLIHKNGEQK